jgi:hypothetical protein
MTFYNAGMLPALLNEDKEYARRINNVEYFGIADHFRLSETGVAVCPLIKNSLNVRVPCVHVLNLQLHHKVVGPVLDVVILQAKYRVPQTTVKSLTPALSQREPQRPIEVLRELKVLGRNVADELFDGRRHSLAAGRTTGLRRTPNRTIGAEDAAVTGKRLKKCLAFFTFVEE